MIKSQYSKRKDAVPRTALSRRGLAASLGGLTAVAAYANQAYAASTAGCAPSLEDLGIVHVKCFGAKGDGMTNDTRAIQAAIDFAQSFTARTGQNFSVMLGPGIFVVDRSLKISGPNRGIAMLGSPWASLQQGSRPPVSTIRWIGGAYPVFNVTSTFTHFISFAIVNNGSATNAIRFAPGGRALLFGMSFVPPSGASAFKDAAVRFDGFDYDSIDRCEFETSPAVKITGSGATLEITRCVFDVSPGGGAPFTHNPILEVDANEIDVFKVERNTFNLQPNANIAFDNSASPSDGFIGVMRVVANEFDGFPDTSSRIILGKNISNLTFEDNQVQALGQITDSPIQLTNSQARVSGNWGASIGAGPAGVPLVRTSDTASRVFVGPNNFAVGSTGGILDNWSGSGGLIDVPLAPPGQAILHGNLGSPTSETVYRIFATNPTSIVVNFSKPGDSIPAGGPGYMTRGQRFTVMVVNVSGSALTNMNSVMFDKRQFKLSSYLISQQTPLQNGKNRSISFVFDGVYAVELWRGTVDVPNSVA
jgi:hypothetical protein